MGKIIILPESLANKIAAGEIIERPSSVVKELIENAIDAGSSKIIINIENGGESLINVSDNGLGMNKDNAILSLKRYATSKIIKYEDLRSIKTLGFRGEALPSISSVSNLSITTKRKKDSVGTKIISISGNIQKIFDTQTTHGTMISVKNLFFNTPVRKKCLKKKSIELTHIIETVLNLSLSNPEIKFKLSHNGKILKNLLSSENKINRIKDVIGKNTSKKLIEIKDKNKKISIEGWISLPELTFSNSKKIHLFVNGRWIVKNKIIQNYILSAYKERIKKGQYPLCIIYLKIPRKNIDINIHPSKKEISFLNEKQIGNLIHKAIKSSFKVVDTLKWNFLSKTPKTDTYNSSISKDFNINDIFKSTTNYKNMDSTTKNTKIASLPIKNKRKNESLKNKKNNRDYSSVNPHNSEKQLYLWEKQFFSELIIIGQHHNSYILCESNNFLIIIDQHAAHERIFFEELKLSTKKTKIKIEELLLPEMIELNTAESKSLEELIPHIKEYGLNIEIFGENTFIVKSIPNFIDKKNILELIYKLIENTNLNEIKSKIINSINKNILLFACHNSVRAKEDLNNHEITKILQKLDKCKNSSFCPHGRPIWIKIDSYSLRKKFGR